MRALHAQSGAAISVRVTLQIDKVREWGPQDAVWDSLSMAAYFIEKAREGGAPNLPQRWCLNVAAGGLWSAVDIFNKKMARGGQRLSRDGVKKDADGWFHQKERLVNQIRHGAVHYEQPHGVGESIAVGEGELTSTASFVWVRSIHDKTPMDEVLSRLSAIRESIEEHVLNSTGTRISLSDDAQLIDH